MITESQARSYILTGGILVAMLGGFIYMRAVADADALNREGRRCEDGGVVVKNHPALAGDSSAPITRRSFEEIEPVFAEAGNLCVFHKIISKAPVAPATAEEMESLQTLLFFMNKGKEIFITRGGQVISLAREEKYLVKPDVTEIIIRQIEEIAPSDKEVER